MKAFTKLWFTLLLLCMAGVTTVRADEEVELSADMFFSWDGFGADATSVAAANVDFNIGSELGAGAMVCGTSTVDYLIYADLTGSTKVLIEGTAGMQLRVLMNRQESNSGPLVERNPVIGEDGKAELDLSDLPYVHLNAIKTGWGSPAGTITSLKVVKPSDPLAMPKETLKKALALGKMQSSFAKTEASFALLQTVIQKAEAELVNEQATAESLAQAAQAVEAAVNALELQAGYTNLTAGMFKAYASLEAPGEGTETQGGFALCAASDLPYGDGSVSELKWADLAAYDKLVVVVATDVKPRFCMNRLVKDGQCASTKEESKMLDINPNNTNTWATEAYQTVDGQAYIIDLKKIVADYGFARLHCIKKQGWGAGVVVTDMLLYKEEAAPEVTPSYGIIWDNGTTTKEGDYSIITLDGALFKGLKAGDILRANFTVGANARAAQPAKIIKSGEISIFVNDIPVYEVKDIAQGTEKIEFALNEEAVAMLGMVQTLTLKYKNMVMSTIEIIEGEPAVDELLKEAEELAADAEAVAVGKLLAAIEAYKADANAEQLQAAIAQFKEDNKDQESDQTAKVATNGWMKFDGTPAGVCATQYAPAITTYDGRTAQLAEVYETTAETVGTIIYQDITGLTNGKYKVGFYGNAFYTPGRGISSTMEDGAEDVAYVFANNEKAFITAHITTETTENDFRQFDVEVTDGTIKLGMGKEQAGTNWHTMQIYQLTWFTSAKEVYANDKAAMQAAIAAAKAQAADPNKSEGKDELNTAIAAAEAALQSNMLNIAEFEAQIQALNAAVADYKKANQFIFDGVAYIIDTESGKMVAAGHDWGTRAIVNETGLDLTFTSNAETRTVTIDTQVSNGGDNHFLGSNLYTDAAAYGWILEYQGFGFYIGNGEQYLNIDANDNLVMSATPREWIIVTADGVMEERMGELAKATAENGVDATFLLKNPNFNRNDLRVSAWQVSEDCTNKNLNGGNNVNNCAESYHSTFTISQLVENAPKGLYKLTAQGYYRQDGEEAEAAPKFFIGDATAEVPAQTGTEGDMAAASESFTAGLYTIEPIEFVFNGEELTVGVTGTAANQWVVFDNFRLTYYGPKTVGISELTSDKSQNAKAIYNLNGQKVQHMTKGLYIRDGKKVLVK